MHAGARRHDDAEGWPPADVVHALHDRYLVEIVEGLGLCPFARRSRELGRVHRPVWWAPPRAQACATKLAAIAQVFPDVEIVLLTFVVAADDPWQDAETFAAFTPELRTAYEQTQGPRFFMVPFHPGFAAQPSSRPESLVPAIRRSPDPVIQCVHADVLERARAQAQQSAKERLRERFAHDPVLAALVEKSVQADPELSAEIARNNFDAVGTGAGRAELERRIADIAHERSVRYAR
jgi:hypothetical protein